GGQANNVGVYPPAPALGQQLVAKQVGKRGRGPLSETAFIHEDLCSADQFRRVAHADLCGHRNARIERIQLEAMSEIDKRFQAQPLIRGERPAPPKRLEKLPHFGTATGCPTLFSRVLSRMAATASTERTWPSACPSRAKCMAAGTFS